MPETNGSHRIVPEATGTSDLATLVLDIERQRDLEDASTQAPILFADDLLPGVGTKEMSLREGLRTAGSATLVVLIALSGLDQLTNSGLSVLAPNIRDTLHVSNGTIVFISSAAGGFLVLGALPMGWLADRYRRPPIIAWASLAFSALMAVCGLAVNAFMLFWAQLGVGTSKANSISVQWSLLADQYPIGVRGRISAALNFGTQSAGALSPLLMAGIANIGWGHRRLAVVIHHSGDSRRRGRSLRLPTARAGTRTTRESQRPGHGDRR